MHFNGESTHPLWCFLTSSEECCSHECFEVRVLLSAGGRFEPTHDVECESDLRVGAIDFESHKTSICNRRV